MQYDPPITNFRTYISALEEMLGGQSWEDVETFAILVWHESGLHRHAPWLDVADLARDAWPEATIKPGPVGESRWPEDDRR